MGYCVYHLEKGNISSGGIGNHIDRIAGKEHSYLHADPSKKDLNVHFGVYQKRNELPLHKAISERIVEGYKTKKAIRKDAVKYCTHVLTGSHQDMNVIFSDEEKANQWIQANFDFLKNEYGKENIVRFTLHLDEKTPHIHAVTVPLTKDGRLSAKEIIGNKSVMQERQDRYADAMKPFKLERGIKNTGIRHEDAKAYYRRLNQAKKALNDYTPPIEKNIYGKYDEKEIQNASETILDLKSLIFEQNQILRKERELNKSLKAKLNPNYESKVLKNEKDYNRNKGRRF